MHAYKLNKFLSSLGLRIVAQY